MARAPPRLKKDKLTSSSPVQDLLRYCIWCNFTKPHILECKEPETISLSRIQALEFYSDRLLGATGDKVVAIKSMVQELLSQYPKLKCIEMESGGCAAAAFESASKPGFLMIKGVSDCGDEAKGAAVTKRWRQYACELSACCVVELLKMGPVTCQSRFARVPKAITGSNIELSFSNSSLSEKGALKEKPLRLPAEEYKAKIRNDFPYLSPSNTLFPEHICYDYNRQLEYFWDEQDTYYDELLAFEQTFYNSHKLSLHLRNTGKKIGKDVRLMLYSASEFEFCEIASNAPIEPKPPKRPSLILSMYEDHDDEPVFNWSLIESITQSQSRSRNGSWKITKEGAEIRLPKLMHDGKSIILPDIWILTDTAAVAQILQIKYSIIDDNSTGPTTGVLKLELTE